MKQEVKDFVINKQLATDRVRRWIGTLTKKEICEKLSISRPTLDRKLKNNKWKLSEIKSIAKNLPY